ncbi:MAG: histone deacetylase, partial [Armatimonadota bacterium]|nr:histone deacetylase [Armatimonadota bacterium]
LERVHRRAYVDVVEGLARAGGGWLDADTPVGPQSARAARLAAGAAQRAVEVLLAGLARRAFVAVRPPGHHAGPDRGMGFCLFNNAAVAAAAARRAGRERVLVVDWDVHHGNGTQAVFWRDPSVLVVSLHQEYWYPGTGAMEELGEGPGEGATVNLPLPAQTGDGGYTDAMTELVLPLAAAFRPEFVIVSAGYDAHFADPLGGMVVTTAGFGRLARLADEAARAADAPLLAILEGGYHLDALAASVVATLEALTGRPADPAAWREPAPADLGARRPGREVPASAIGARLRAIRRLLLNYWRL